jgi:hypothetical protein
VAAGSSTFPPPDRSGAVPPLGRSQFPRALLPGQRSSSRRWHPCCCRCLLKGCEGWFLPDWPQARFCSRVCQRAAQWWRRWRASKLYRTTNRGKERRREQGRRYRIRIRQRSSPDEPAPPTRPVEPAPLIEVVTPPKIEVVTPSEIGPPSLIPAVCEGQRPARICEDSCGLPCHRPGCYVLFFVSVSSPHRQFCSSLCRQALRRVRQRGVRFRHRRRRGARLLRHPYRGPPQTEAFMSSHS